MIRLFTVAKPKKGPRSFRATTSSESGKGPNKAFSGTSAVLRHGTILVPIVEIRVSGIVHSERCSATDRLAGATIEAHDGY